MDWFFGNIRWRSLAIDYSRWGVPEAWDDSVSTSGWRSMVEGFPCHWLHRPPCACRRRLISAHQHAIESPKFPHHDLAHCAPENGDWVPLWFDSKVIQGWKRIAGQYVERSKSLRGCEKGPRKRISAGSTSTPWFLDFLVNSSPCEVFFGQVDSMMF